MDRINQTVLMGLIRNMSRVMGEPLQLQKGSAYNGIAWAVEYQRNGQAVIIGKTARELYEKAHSFMAGWYAHEDMMRSKG